jgi:opacity protein-like surface antigen
MKRILLAVVVTSLLAAAGATAQVLGVPVYNRAVSSGIGLQADIAFPNQDYGKGKAFAGTGVIGLGPLGLTGSIASYKPKGGQSITSVGGTVNFKVFGGPLVPLSVNFQAGAGYFKEKVTDIKNLRVPVGIGFALKIPSPAVSLKPWIAPRIDYVRRSGGLLPTSDSETNFAFSAGLDLDLLSGLGFQAAYDRTKVKNPPSRLSTFALGVHYQFKLPGMP